MARRINRRRLLSRAATAAVGASQLLWAPPSFAKTQTSEQTGAGHDAYFSALNEMLKQQGPAYPVMLLDQQRINHNVDQLVRSVGADKTYRVVVKSLPSVPLLQHVMERAKTNALMVFHQPFLSAIAQNFADADVLMGKPMPVRAAAEFYRTFSNPDFDPATQIQWLIDSQARLAQYLQLAQTLGVRMKLNFEIDVGLHRGGFDQNPALAQALATVSAHPQHLSVGGLMGYEPHLTGLKADLQHPQVREVLGTYQGFIDTLKAAGLNPQKLTLNGAGSHTLKIYEQDNTMNDLSAGSGVVMPTDFDTFHLQDHKPAAFIATPILKRYDSNPFMAQAPVDMQRLYYIYGGYWKAQMVSPREVGDSLYESTNQSPITTSTNVNLQVDDYMFLRPTQSEFVMLQFGDLLAFRGKDKPTIVARWPVFHQTG